MLLLAIAAGAASAQSDPAIDIHGVVTEVGLGLGLSGAEVTIFEFAGPERERKVYATAVTDANGEFRFHPEHFGDFWVEVRKQAYFATVPMDGVSGSIFAKPPTAETGTLVTVSAAHPSLEVRFALMRPGDLMGSVLDENDNPVPGTMVEITMAGSAALARAMAVTDKEGSFSAKMLMPGEYLVKVSPSSLKSVTAISKFSEDDLKVVDEGPQTVYWPGAPDERSASTVRVSPGASVSLGTVRMRTTPSYRARVSMPGCKTDDLPYFNLSTPNGGQVLVQNEGAAPTFFFNSPNVTSCQDLLVKGLKPGSYTFLLSSKRGWAAVAVEVANKNLEVSLTLSAGVDISGRIVAGEGVPPPAFDKIGIAVAPLETGTGAKATPDAKGIFLAYVMGPSHRVSVSGLGDKYYVREVRVDGRAASGAVVRLYQGSQLEIVLDDQPATLTGSVADGDKPFSQPLVFVAKWPSLETTPRPVTGDNEGKFHVTGLEPGEYRVLAVQSTPLPDGQQIGSQMLSRLWSGAEKVTLERGGTQSVALKLSDPLR
jgi:hypothetical protein